MQDSALFWHYAMRHVPSDSLICASEILAQGSTQQQQQSSTLKFVDRINLQSKDPNAFLQPPSEGYPLHGYAAFPIGASASGCICGWKKFNSSHCEAPVASICTAIFPGSSPPMAPGAKCLYNASLDIDDDVEARILEAWRWEEWPCPSMDISDGWGIVPASDAEDWIRMPRASSTFSASLAEVIYSGRAGLRIGNMKSISNASKPVMKPISRKLAKSAAQKACAGNILSTFDANSLAKSIADDLIPVSQGVYTESWPVSVCLRFSIEFLRLRVLRTLQQASFMEFRRAEIKQAADLQQAVVQAWKHKCESQVCSCYLAATFIFFDTYLFSFSFLSSLAWWLSVRATASLTWFQGNSLNTTAPSRSVMTMMPIIIMLVHHPVWSTSNQPVASMIPACIAQTHALHLLLLVGRRQH